jgi:hypothetical protein
MFYIERLLKMGLDGIDRTNMLSAITGIAYAILVVGFLLGLYRAAMRGGDLQALGVTSIKYIVVGIIVANWSTVFHGINDSFTQIAHLIGASSGAADVFLSWLDQLKQQFDADGTSSLWHLITGGGSAMITVLLVIVAYLIYALSIIVFGFFHTLYGCVLYVLGPLVLALLPMPGVGPLARSFATNVFIWNGGVVLYAIFGALITAIQANRINDLFSFMGFFTGSIDSLLLGLISIFYALALLLIPFIAKKIVSGDVGSTAYDMVRAAAVLAGAAVSAGAGAAAGAGSAAGGSSGAGAGGATAGSAVTGTGAGAGGTAATSSSMPPPQPSLAGSIRSAVASAFNGGAPPVRSSGSASSQGSGGSEKKSSASSGSGGSTPLGFRPVGVVQSMAFHAGRMAGRAVAGAANSSDTEDGK